MGLKKAYQGKREENALATIEKEGGVVWRCPDAVEKADRIGFLGSSVCS